MPAFNAEKFIQTSIESIISQTYQNFELLIINDGSSDNSKQLIDSNKDLYSKAIHLEKNSGKGRAVIVGIKE